MPAGPPITPGMTATAEDQTQLIGRDELARAIRAAAAAWEGPRVPGELPRDVAEDAISCYVTDQPRRGSQWAGDGQPGLTPDQARRAVRYFTVTASVPGREQQALEAVLAALEDRQAPQAREAELSPGAAGYRPRCAHCGEAIPPERGPLARFCSSAHKQAAWKAKQRETGQEPGLSPRHPHRRPGSC